MASTKDAMQSGENSKRFGPVLTDDDLYYIGTGQHQRIWHALGAHVMTHENVDGVHFAVWAPNAQHVSVIGDFNYWNGFENPMTPRGSSGIWEVFIPGVTAGAAYKYAVTGIGGDTVEKADPMGFGAEHPPATASVVRNIKNPEWSDTSWMKKRDAHQNVSAPISVYEVHIGSWRRVDHGRPLSYLELARDLIAYVKDLGFTHIELMPISAHPFDGSWGYQPIGLYAPTIRHGTPDEFRAFITAAHEADIGVLLDWVPGHFPADEHGLARFDGTALYEHEDPKEGFHPDWNTYIYNFGRPEVANFLTSNALYWLEEFHLDGIRVDAVASMLYRDYSRNDGEWIPNKDGGRENYEAIALLQNMNINTYGAVDGIMTVAEESTAFPGVSRPVDHGGLGFGFKWNMGWMNDTLSYMEADPIYRSYDHHKMTFGIDYAFSENYLLPISHDEVVHGKGSMIAKMPGNDWEKFANLRAYYGFMWSHPGKKLIFMGCEFAQWGEWNHGEQLEWHLLDDPRHAGVQKLIRDLNGVYRAEKGLHVNDCRPEGFKWLEGGDTQASVFAFARFGDDGDDPLVAVVNMTPMERSGYRVGFPAEGTWDEIINTDATEYGGGGRGNMGQITTQAVSAMGEAHSAELTLPPLSTIIFRPSRKKPARTRKPAKAKT
ncbi:1,4-alpha-glucan branching protein GlgB [Yoonia sp. 208BN28-4]|uniref:1,4-alpha-glucan branching protein GlgB n=1 Tax=Yoonia sp. 208BN28-4 TaxID=3126505 RepID=UPI0030A84EAA